MTMSEENGGGQKRNMIGMARLSCMPCRRRKSKCDREVPCSSCALRNTERFCYTSEVEDEVAKPANSAHSHSADKTRQSSGESPGESPSSVGRGGPKLTTSTSSRPSKKIKVDNDEGRSKYQTDESVNAAALDRQSILKTIETMETAIQGLRETIGVQSDIQSERKASIPTNAKWEDVSHFMPSKQECELIIDYFFSEAQWHSSLIHSGMFRKLWTNLMNGQAIKSVYLSQACSMIALSLAFAPGYHAVSRLSIQPKHSRYCTLAHEILEPSSIVFLDRSAPSVEDIQAHCLIVAYMSFTGGMESYWQEVGKTVRLCKSLQLYDEEKWNMRELSDWDVELRRRLAFDICVPDRWLSLTYQRISDLPAEFRTTRPGYYSFENFDVNTGRRQFASKKFLSNAPWELGKYLLTCGADRVNRYLYNFLRLTPEQRYEEARQVDSFIDSLMQQLPREIDYEIAFKKGVSPSSPETARLAGQALIGYTSSARLRCLVMRQFLLDPKSPPDLRVAALEHARKIVETTSDLVTMSTNPWLSFSSAWCSNHLFCAASTFAIVYLGDEREQNLQDLNWFASKIFEVIEAMSFLSAKDPVSKRCEELLTALCTSKDWLRERFLASRSGRAATQYRRKGSSHDSSTTQSTHQEDLSNALKGNIPGFNSLLMKADPYSDGSNGSAQGGTSMSTHSNSTNSALWNSSPLPISLSNMAPSQAMISSPEAINQLQNNVAAPDKVDSSEAWANWPLLNDQQWFSLLNTLEQDMSALAGNNTIPL